MNRRDFLCSVGLGIPTLMSSSYAMAGTAASAKKPNILFLFADDLCWDALSVLGSEMQTPNVDRLARKGTMFTNAYNQGAWHGAVCVASRTMFATGAFLWRAKGLEPKLERERKAGRLWPQYMAEAGYGTYMCGKWHVKTPPEKVFGTTQHVRGGMPKQTDAGYNRPVEGKPDAWSPSDPAFGGYWEGGKHWSEVVADDAAGFLAEAATKAEPFFIYAAFNAPHDPRQSPQEFVDRYPPESLRTPESFLPEYPYKDAMGCSKDLRDEKLAPFPRTEYAVKVNRQEYYAIIAHMDEQVGRILDALDASGMAEDTYIFFTADHGLAVGRHGLLGKQNMFEHSMKAPLIVGGPGIPKGKRIAAPVYIQDIMPTALELAGSAVPERVQFKSLLPLIRGERKSSYDAIYGGYMDLQRMVRMDGWKLIYYPKIKRTLLFDLKNDPHEMHDLAGNAEYAPKLEELWETLLRLQKKTGDRLRLGTQH